MHSKFGFRIAAIAAIAAIVVVAAVAGCATDAQSTRTAAAANAQSGSTMRNVSSDNQVVGAPTPDSKFAKVRLGMSLGEVDGLIGGGDDQNHYPTGKGWIPFYFGSDTQRIEVLYRGEGCLTYTGGNQFGGGSNQLIRIEVDPNGRCFKT